MFLFSTMTLRQGNQGCSGEGESLVVHLMGDRSVSPAGIIAELFTY